MASKQQVRDWVMACLREHLRPDVLRVEPASAPNGLYVVLREPGTKDTEGQTFRVWVEYLR